MTGIRFLNAEFSLIFSSSVLLIGPFEIEIIFEVKIFPPVPKFMDSALPHLKILAQTGNKFLNSGQTQLKQQFIYRQSAKPYNIWFFRHENTHMALGGKKRYRHITNSVPGGSILAGGTPIRDP